MSRKLTCDNTAFFSVSDDNGVSYPAVALLSIKKVLPKAKLFLIGSYFTDQTKKKMKRLGISCIEINLLAFFSRSWDGVAEKFYEFAGPEYFLKAGYEYSVFVDESILCIEDPLEKMVDTIAGIAGVAANRFNEMFGAEMAMPRLYEKKILNAEDAGDRKRIQGGVVYYNNKRMKELDLLKNSKKIFLALLEKDNPPVDPDSLLALLQLIIIPEKDVAYLEKDYNYMPIYYGFEEDRKKLVFFHFDSDKPWKKFAYMHVKNEKYAAFDDLISIWRRFYKRYFIGEWSQTLAQHEKYTKRKVARFKRKLYREGLAYDDITRERNGSKSPIKLYWYRNKRLGLRNFGDEFSVDLLCELFGYNAEYARVRNCELIMIGSILEVAQNENNGNAIKVWGSGYIRKRNSADTNGLSSLDFCAVRGKLTRERLGIYVPVGDPGLLASVVYPKRGKKNKKVGIVVHYIDLDLPIVDKLFKDERFIIINPLERPEIVAKKISSCKMILSSSLHGLIFADSYGVPNVHLPLSKRVTGGDYKFNDYYSAVDKEHVKADVEKIFDGNYLAELEKGYEPIKNLKEIQRSLVASFPF